MSIGIPGMIDITDFAPDSFITIKRNKPTYTSFVGVSGEVARCKTTDLSGTIEFTLMQSSPSNAILSLLRIGDELLYLGVVPVQIKDDKSIHIAAYAWLVGQADANYGAEAGARKWVLQCASLDMYEGGLPQL